MISICQVNQSFRSSIEKKNYIDKSLDGVTLINTDVKISRLDTIFTLAHGQISSASDLKGKDICELKALQENGKLLYERYERSTRSWRRAFLKGLARYTPEFLKQFLPSCFSNKMEKAEERTRKAYDDFSNLIEDKLSTLEKNVEKCSILQSEITQKIENIECFERHPFSLQKYKWLLSELAKKLISLYSLDSENKYFLDRGLTSEFSNTLLNALSSSSNDQIASALGLIGCDQNFKEALKAEDNTLSFSIQRIGGERIHRITTLGGIKVKESELDNYRGYIKLSIANPQESEVVDNLITTLAERPNFLPHTVIILLSDEHKLAHPLTDRIAELINRGIEVDLEGISTIDLGELVPQHSPLFSDGTYPLLSWSNLNKLIVRDTEEFNWDNDTLTHFLDDPRIHSRARVLDLQRCSNLTTDILFTLATLPVLEALYLPNLPRGKTDLKQLPQFDDAYKIGLFYLPSTSTRSLILDLYTGPIYHAAHFQIQLARMEERVVFFPNQKVLDPITTALWLGDENYKYLEPQLNIHTVILDNNLEISNETLEAFIKKFPNLTHLSLYNCQKITTQGIINTLRWCNKLEFLDLTNCSGIEEDFPLNEYIQKHLKRLDRLEIIGKAFDQGFDFQSPTQSERRSNQIDLDIFEYPQMNLCFKINQLDDTPRSFNVDTVLLYAQSTYFREQLRPGGVLFQKDEVEFVNLHATPEAADAFNKLINGKLEIERLNWRVAAHLAELIGPKIFRLHPSHYKALLSHIHEHFDIDEADDFLLTALQLEDNEGTDLYQSLLIDFLGILGPNDLEEIRKISALAESYNLEILKDDVEIKLLLALQNLR